MGAKDPENLGRTPDSLRVFVPDALGHELAQCIDTAKAATARRDEIILDLLRMGCSLRDISRVSGMAHSRIRQIGEKAGWPPPEVKEARQRAVEEHRRWTEQFRQEYGQ